MAKQSAFHRMKELLTSEQQQETGGASLMIQHEDGKWRISVINDHLSIVKTGDNFLKTTHAALDDFIASEEQEGHWSYPSFEVGSSSRGEIAPGVEAADYNGVYAYLHYKSALYVIGASEGKGDYVFHINKKPIAGDPHADGISFNELKMLLKKLGLPQLDESKFGKDS